MMYGVILWSDHQSGAAVIWCEDRAEIAYHHASGPDPSSVEAATPPRFDAGDLVQFDLCAVRGRRLEVSNLRAAITLRHDMPSVYPGCCDIYRRVRVPRAITDSASVVDLHAVRPRPDTPPPRQPGGISRRG